MKPGSDPQPFDRALLIVAGHAPAASTSEAVTRWLPFARRLHAARTRVLAAERCPGAVRHRVRAVFAERRSRRGALAALVFDSWADLAPAARGASAKRMLEYRGDDLVLHVQVEPEGRDATRLHLAADRPGVEFHVHLDGGDDEPLVVEGDAHGVASLGLAAGRRAERVSVFEDGREILRAASPRPEA